MRLTSVLGSTERNGLAVPSAKRALENPRTNGSNFSTTIDVDG